MNKKTGWTVAILALIAGVVGYAVLLGSWGGPARPSKSGALRIAVLLNLVGPTARYDADKQKTIALAIDRVKELHPELGLECRIFDAGGEPGTTAAAVRQARKWGASYYLSGTSPTALTIAAQVRDLLPPVVQLANAAIPDFGPPRAGEYRFWPDWVQEADIVSGVLRQQGYDNALLIHSADPYSEALTKELTHRVKFVPGLALRDFQYDPAGTSDFRPAILRAKADGIKAIVVFGLPPGIRSLIAQLAEAGWEGSLIGGVNINLAEADYVKAGLSGPLWLVETEAMRDSLSPESEAHAFRVAYEKRQGTRPPFHALYLADGLYFAAAAHTGPAAGSADEVQRARTVRHFDGASGAIDVTEDGNLRFDMGARRVH